MGRTVLRLKKKRRRGYEKKKTDFGNGTSTAMAAGMLAGSAEQKKLLWNRKK